MRKAIITRTAALLGAAVSTLAPNPNTDYITPSFTFSPDGRYGVMIPVWHDERAYEPDHRVNKVVELRTNHVVAVIHAKPGYNRALNFHETARRVGRQIRLFCSEKSVANGIPTLWF